MTKDQAEIKQELVQGKWVFKKINQANYQQKPIKHLPKRVIRLPSPLIQLHKQLIQVAINNWINHKMQMKLRKIINQQIQIKQIHNKPRLKV